MIKICIQTQDFNVNHELEQLKKASNKIGGIVSFTGCVRDMNNNQTINTLHLEHYPQMTEQVINDVVQTAQSRWNMIATTVIHRIGTLEVGDNIVMVACATKHREDGFLACEFIMDFLKSNAPFWKKEQTQDGKEYWVEAKNQDNTKKLRWKT